MESLENQNLARKEKIELRRQERKLGAGAKKRA